MKGNSQQNAARRPSRQDAFLEALTQTVNVTLACRRAGLSRRTVYDWRAKDEAFARKWDEALDEGVDLLEAELHRRAFEGVERPVFYKGQQCGAWRYYSDALAMFLLRVHRPEKYRGQGTAEKQDDAEAEVRVIRKLMEGISARNREAEGHPPPSPAGDQRPTGFHEPINGP